MTIRFRRQSPFEGRKFFSLIVCALIILILGGLGYLATWDIPRSTTEVEKIIPNDRFPR